MLKKCKMKSLNVGQIVNTHGVKGEVKVYPYTDDIDNLASLKKIYLDENMRNIDFEEKEELGNNSFEEKEKPNSFSV